MTTPGDRPRPVTFRLAPVLIGVMWSGVALGGVFIIGPMVVPGEGAEFAFWVGTIFALLFGTSAMLSHRYHIVYDPEAKTVTTATVGRRVADLNRPARLTPARDPGQGYYLRIDDAGKVGLYTGMVSDEGYDVHDLAAELYEAAPELEVTPDLAAALTRYARASTPLHERKRSTATRYLLQLTVLVTAVVAGPQLFGLLYRYFFGG